MALDVFVEIAIIIMIATIVASIMQALKQPLLIGYIITGILVSPYFFNLIPSETTLETFSHLGVAILLFMVGLNLDPKMIKDVGKVSLYTGIGQVLFTSLFGFLLGYILGFSLLVSAYIAFALTFSSTIIITKLLSDKKDLESLYGRVSVGLLIVQDLVVVVALLLLGSSFGSNSAPFVQTVISIFGFILLLYIISKKALPIITNIFAKSQEMLLLFSIGWCFSVAAVSYYLNFSIEAGSLLAGISLAMSPYRYEISAKMKPLRDFFLVLFFVFLGSQMVFSDVSSYIPSIIIFSLFILIGNPFIVFLIMNYLGYTKRNSFLTGLTVAQISEFSLIFIAMGVTVGHVSLDILSLVTVVGLITISASTYLILYSDFFYKLFLPFLTLVEKTGPKKDNHCTSKAGKHNVVLFGYNRTSFDLLHSLKKLKKKVLVVDHNPERVKILEKEGIDYYYADASDPEIMDTVLTSSTKMIISTIPDFDANISILQKSPKKCISIILSQQVDEALKFYELGASYVILPHYLGGHHTSALIEDYKFNIKKFLKQKVVHLDYLTDAKRNKHH